MTMALMGYSGVFMRYAFAVTPANYLLFGCHAVNFTAQSVQGYRYMQWFHFGGREKSLEHGAQDVKREGEKVGMKAEGLVNQAKEKAVEVKEKAKDVVGR